MPTDSEQSGLSPSEVPLVSYRRMFELEVEQAKVELDRPLVGLFVSGVAAGLAVGLSMMFVTVMKTESAGSLSPMVATLLMANAYTVGFIVTIMGHTDLFTEYTTIALFPALTGHASIRKVLRLWSVVYLGNIAGGALFAVLIVILGPRLHIIELSAIGDIGREIVNHPWWVVLLSGIVAGWLMGNLSWLIAGARDTVSQIAFIWIIAFLIGLGGLHHSIVGAVEVLAAVIAAQGLVAMDFGYFLLWATLGNAVGGFVFAVLVKASVRMSPKGRPRQGDRERQSSTANSSDQNRGRARS